VEAVYESLKPKPAPAAPKAPAAAAKPAGGKK